ncbi:MAG TPA: pentapeptide repeat-containing protein [Archangium sp.]|uniref:WD40 domain-containing protein n=1 Tax=Archangium sp. TaxID=1872627 RepID=UPI002E355A5D|nr:pentapeptide repeat-containing protein [Archangium sp.]HEX5747343.1 pentapeptide repeat-containing protein [Archangium sp.]
MVEALIDVLIVTALKDELDALLDIEVDGAGRSAWTETKDRHDFPFHVRELSNEHGELLHLAAAWSGEMGESAATERAGALIDELDPACLAMCGICAGRRGEVFLGDVIVASRVFSYDRGKQRSRGPGHEEDFLHDIETYNLEATWSMKASFFAEEFQRDWEERHARPPSKASQGRWLLHTLRAHQYGEGPSPKEHPERRTHCPGWADRIQELREAGLLDKALGRLQLTENGLAHVEEEQLRDPDGQARDPSFRVHVGPLATGRAVKEDPELFARLSRSVRKVLGVEMEAAAIGFVAERRGRRSLIVKAVSDYADQDKDDAYRRFACRGSAAFLVAFLRKHLRPQEPDSGSVRGPLGRSLEDKLLKPQEKLRDDFLARVERACVLRAPEGTEIIRRQGPAPFGPFLEVSVFEGQHRFQRVFPVAVLDAPPTQDALEAFLRGIHARYHRENPSVISTLVHVGHAAPEELARRAYGKQVHLMSFAEYQGLIDFSAYLRRQTARLEADPIYPPALYVPQRAQVSIGGQGPTPQEDILTALRGLLESPGPRFALVLGDFGTGKTFLLHELARRLASEDSALVPVLIEMRSLQKQRTLRELVAQHFAAADMGRMEVDKFLYMLREGRIVLLFDGFDELALRITYDRVLEHFETLIEAAGGDAKVVITSRTQHFLTDQDVKQELARRAEVLRGYRLIKLERFSEEQIQHFLLKRLGGESMAGEYMGLLRDVKDLLGLSENPRMLSFIADLGTEKLRAARARSGEISSAELYALLLSQWITGEYRRVNPAGAPKGLSWGQLRSAVTDLALLLWGRTERTVSMSELPEELLAAVNAQGEHALDAEVIRHQLGSGSLLVRDEEGRFSFVHQSVLEWLVAEHAMRELREKGEAFALSQREMSDLMADFFIALAGPQQARDWAQGKTFSTESGVALRNALRILGRMRKEGVTPAVPVLESRGSTQLSGSDLRGQDLSGAELRGADLSRANLSGMTLVGADLSEADLREAQLARAELGQAKLRGANLAGANLAGASLMGADLRGANLRGARLRAAKLIGAKVDSLEGADLSGAALPGPAAILPTVMADAACLSVAFSPRDGLIASSHLGGDLRLWDALTGKGLRVLVEAPPPQAQSPLPPGADLILDIAFSPDGELLASSSAQGVVRLWSVASGRVLRVLEGNPSSLVRRIAFSPDGALLAAVGNDGKLCLWSVASGGRPLRTLDTGLPQLESLAFGPDGGRLATASVGGLVYLYDVVDGQFVDSFKVEAPPPLLDLAFHPDGSTLAIASSNTVTLRALGDGTSRRSARQPGLVTRVSFSPDGAMLALACTDGSIQVWDGSESNAPHTLRGHSEIVRDLAFSPEGGSFISGSEDGTLRVWSTAEGQLVRTLRGHSGVAQGIAFSLMGGFLASASSDATVCLWDFEAGKLVFRLDDHLGPVQSVAFSPDQRLLVSASEEAVSLWRLADARALLLRGHSERVSSVAFSPHGSLIASGSRDRTVRLWSASGDSERVLLGHRGAVGSVAFSPDNATLASSSDDGIVRLWRIADGQCLRELESWVGSCAGCVAFSPDGVLLASAAEKGSIYLWSVFAGKRLRTLKGAHEENVRSLAFSPDGKTLASVATDGTLCLWDLVMGGVPRVRAQHGAFALGVAFSPDGRTVASVADDGAVRLWDAATGASLATLLHLPEGWVAFRPDGHYRCGGDLGGAFWHAVDLCRFEPGELEPYLPTPLRLSEDEPFLPRG